MKTECKVYGGLAAILPWCRIVGVAPVKLSRENKCFRASFCKTSMVYGYMLVLALIISALSTDVIKCIATWTNGTYQKTNLTHLPQTGSLFAIVVLVSLQARRRVINMFGYLTELQQITYFKGIDMKREWKAAIITTILAVIYIVLEIWDTVTEISASNNFITYLYCFGNIKFLMMQYMMMKVILMYIEVCKALQALSVEIQEMINHESDVERGKSRLRIVNKHYIIVCEVIMKITKDVSLYCVLAFIYNIVTMMDTTSFIAAHFIARGQNDVNWLFIFRQCNWITVQVVRLILFLEPFQNIEAKKTNIKCLIAKLMYRWTDCGELMCGELAQAVKQLLTISTDVAPLGLFRYSRALVITTLSIVMTYAIVELQFKIHDIHSMEEESHALSINSTISL